MTSNRGSRGRKRSQPRVDYQFVEAENGDNLDDAFDILFEEVLKNEDLTAMDN